MEVEHAVPAVLGRAVADAPVQLLVGVVVAGDVPALDAPDHRAVGGRHGSSHLAQHDERWNEQSIDPQVRTYTT